MDQIVVDPVVLGALATLVVIIAAALGFLLGQRRPRAEDLARIAELEAELQTEQSSAESRSGDIDEHFEASAALFGKLAQDYRALFEHWADSATKLGVSEARADAIIDQARSRLLENTRAIDPDADPSTDAPDEAESSAETSEGGGDTGAAAASDPDADDAGERAEQQAPDEDGAKAAPKADAEDEDATRSGAAR